MGLTREYLRFASAGNFNIIASPKCNIVFVTLEGQEGRYVAVGASEHVIIWDLRLGEKAQVIPGETAIVTHLCASPNKKSLVIGYSDGNIQICDLKTAEVITIFSGHHSEITSLACDSFGHKLASGSKDTDIVVWDTIAEVGICRLIGHKGPITHLAFMSSHSILCSASKDSFVKFWDLDTQHCFKTLVGHRTEVWALTLMKDDDYLVTGCGDAELRVWKLSFKNTETENKTPLGELTTSFDQINDPNAEKESKVHSFYRGDDVSNALYPLQCHKAGSLLRSGRGRVVTLESDATGQVMACHGTDAQIELFHFLTQTKAELRLKKRLKKERKKEKKDENTEAPTETNQQLTLRDEVKRLACVKLPNKCKSLNLVLGNGGELRVATVLSNNTIDLYSVNVDSEDVAPKCLRTIMKQGHHGEVRAVSFSSDNLAIVSGSTESIKMWNRPTQTCLRTVETGYVLSTIFVPGDRHVLAGLKDGRLLIIDIAAGDVLEDIPAHKTELWSICLQPDLRGCVTGGGDNTVKFWQFELVTESNSETKAKVLSMLHTRTLKLDDNVLCVRISPNGKFLAAALLDSTVKIFFVDTFKFYLSLYGHKLPVLSLDISSDSTLIATGSADRNVKIWGMDFGDCHKSIFAHNDSVTSVQFVPRTHYFFTCGKDGKVKQWDGDSFNKIITLQSHSGEAWNLAVSPNGQYVVSCGADRVLRMHEKTDQPLVLQDEEEDEREQQEALATGEQTNVPGHPGHNLPSKKTIGSEKAAESILECLDICEKFREQLGEHAALQLASSQPLPFPNPPPLMRALNVTTPNDFILETVKRIRSSDLEEALLLLPFPSVCELMQCLPALIGRGDQTELVCKLMVFLLKIHHPPIVAHNALLSTLKQLQKSVFVKVEELRDLIGYNFYGMQFLQREIEAAEGVQMFRDATMERKRGEKKRKAKEKLKRSIMAMS